MYEILLTIPETSEWLKEQPQTLAVWRKTGTGPAFIQINRKSIRYPKRAVLEFLARKTVITNQHVESATAESAAAE
jgi:hypothetical protein